LRVEPSNEHEVQRGDQKRPKLAHMEETYRSQGSSSEAVLLAKGSRCP
jgi:hypothetical protein